MKKPRWLLRRRLRQAARLLRRKVINEWQYSAFALEVGSQLIGRPLEHGQKVDRYTFGFQLSAQLVDSVSDEAGINRSFEVFGPYNQATVTLQPSIHADLIWDSDQQNRARSARLYLSPFRRLALGFQSWWGEQESLFPLFTKLTAFILGLVIGGVIGHFIR